VVYTLDLHDGVANPNDASKNLFFTTNEKKYQVKQFHFHWGSAEIEKGDISYLGGSEHTVNGNHFPIEVRYLCT